VRERWTNIEIQNGKDICEVKKPGGYGDVPQGKKKVSEKELKLWQLRKGEEIQIFAQGDQRGGLTTWKEGGMTAPAPRGGVRDREGFVIGSNRETESRNQKPKKNRSVEQKG